MIDILAFILTFNIYVSASLQTDTSCQPFPVMVPIQNAEIHIVVHQCRGRFEGSVYNPNIQCVNITSDHLDRFLDDGEQVYNHTCSMELVCDLNQDKDTIPNELRSGVCYYHEKWNAASCKCESKALCTPDSKKSVNRGYISSSSIELNPFIIVLVGEFLLLVFIAYIIRRLCKSEDSGTDSENEIVLL